MLDGLDGWDASVSISWGSSVVVGNGWGSSVVVGNGWGSSVVVGIGWGSGVGQSWSIVVGSNGWSSGNGWGSNGWGSSDGNNLSWFLVKVWLSWDLLVDVWLGWDLLMNVWLGWDFLVNVWFSWDFLVDVWLGWNLGVDVWLSSWVDLAGIVVWVDGSNCGDSWGMSVSDWGSGVSDGSVGVSHWGSGVSGTGVWEDLGAGSGSNQGRENSDLENRLTIVDYIQHWSKLHNFEKATKMGSFV